jgi:hypothetical protein
MYSVGMFVSEHARSECSGVRQSEAAGLSGIHTGVHFS